MQPNSELTLQPELASLQEKGQQGDGRAIAVSIYNKCCSSKATTYFALFWRVSQLIQYRGGSAVVALPYGFLPTTYTRLALKSHWIYRFVP